MIQLILGRPLVVATLVVLLLAFYGLRSGRKELDGLTDASDLLTQVENYKRESEKLREDNEECWRLIKALREGKMGQTRPLEQDFHAQQESYKESYLAVVDERDAALRELEVTKEARDLAMLRANGLIGKLTIAERNYERAKNGKKHAEEQEKRLSKKETEWWNLREQLEKENRKLKKELKIKTSKKILTKVAAAIQAEEDSSRKPKNNVSKRKAV